MTERPPLRLVYLVDSMADIRMAEGWGTRAELTVLAPSFLGDRVTNYWPPRPPAAARKEILQGSRVTFMLRAAWWLRRHRSEVDVVFVLDNLTAALAATLARWMGGPPPVLQVGRSTLEYLRCQRGSRLWLLRYVVAWALIQVNERSAAGIAAVSDHCAVQSRARNGRVWSIPGYGVDLAKFRPGDKATARKRLSLPLDKPIVMLRSRIAPEKDPETFLAAVARLRADGRQFTALYMGGEIDQMTALAEAAGVSIDCRKPANVDEIPDWYVASDVDVQPSKAEGLGVSPLESLACGVPVVVSDAGGLGQVVDGGRVGLLVPVGDAVALADAIGRYLDDPALAAEHATLGRQWVEDRFGEEATFELWLDLARVVAKQSHPDTPTRILFVDHEARLSGGQRDLVDLVRGLDPKRFEVHVALPGPGPLADALVAQGVVVHHVEMVESLRKMSRWDLARRPDRSIPMVAHAWAASRSLSDLAADLRPDVIHTNSMKSHILAVPAAVRTRTPLVWHMRDILERGWLRQAMAVAAQIFATRVVSLSDVAAEPFRVGRLADRVKVVHNGIRPQDHTADDQQEWRDATAAGPDEILVVLAGQIARWKGQDVFVEAAAIAAREVPNLRFAVVGECLFPENEGEFDRAIRERAHQLGLDGVLTFTGPAPTIEPVMAAADIAVHCSRLPEPFGRVVVEAMAQSTPVVSTTIGAGPEIVTEEAGILVPADDPAALAAALVDLAQDPIRRSAMGRAAKTRAAQFDISVTADGVVQVWRDVIR